jgi:rod shape-determining protein MreD
MFVAVALALALQTTLARTIGGDTPVVDIVLVAVVYVALTMGPVSGLLAGTVAGLLQDALSSGVIGIGGLAKSIVGFAVGAIGQQFILTSAFPRLLTFLGATAAHAVLFMGLYVVLGLRTFQAVTAPVVAQMIGNAIVGMIVITAIEAFPGMLERRRARRRPRL